MKCEKTLKVSSNIASETYRAIWYTSNDFVDNLVLDSQMLESFGFVDSISNLIIDIIIWSNHVSCDWKMA